VSGLYSGVMVTLIILAICGANLIRRVLIFHWSTLSKTTLLKRAVRNGSPFFFIQSLLDLLL